MPTAKAIQLRKEFKTEHDPIIFIVGSWLTEFVNALNNIAEAIREKGECCGRCSESGVNSEGAKAP